MTIKNLRKESSERSDWLNWVKKILIKETDYFFDSIEWCSENRKDIVTHLMERARFDYIKGVDSTLDEIFNEIKRLEWNDVLNRKINFAKCFNLPLIYILYCDETEYVHHFEIISLDKIKHVQSHKNYKSFSDWLSSIKWWKSTKQYREIPDLPHFDKELRKHGTAWPTNIDCFISNNQNEPIAILEFQNAKQTSVSLHSNNKHFLCLIKKADGSFSDDIRRWRSQEIIRVQSWLKFIIITWSQHSLDFHIKEIDMVIIPDFTQWWLFDWAYMMRYKNSLHEYANNPSEINENNICKSYSTLSLSYKNTRMDHQLHQPLLSRIDKTFPFIYYKKKSLSNNEDELIKKINEFLT